MPRKVNIPLAFGRADRVDPKVAPLGTLAVAKNLRVLKDGRLGSRRGYQPLQMTQQDGDTLTAYDLMQFSDGRLCALGSHNGEDHAVDVYEYRALPASRPWRSSDESGGDRQTLTPFTAPRQVCGVPQPAGGVSSVDVAAGGGYVCAVYVCEGADLARAQCVRESDDQVILARDCAVQGWESARICFAGGAFYVLGLNDNGDLTLGKWTPGSTDTNFSVIATVESAGTVEFFEIQAVNNGSASIVICVYGISGDDIVVKRYNASGTQQGSTLTVAGLSNLVWADVEADETDATVNVVVSTDAVATTLRTFDFSNNLLDGPTSLTAVIRPTICRLPAQSGWAESVCVVGSNNSAKGDIVVQYVEVDTHTIVSETIGNAVLASAVIPAPATSKPSGVVFGGYVDPDELDGSTNALWYVDRSMTHMATRDLRSSAQRAGDNVNPLGLSYDSSTGRLAWASLFFVTGSVSHGIENFTVTTLALHSTARRQAVSAGGLLYIAGAPVQVYDGRILTEVGFNEVPGIISAAQDTDGGLTQLGTYSYVYTWEYNLPDGTFFESPPSPPFTLTLTGANDEVTLTVKGPHSARVSLGSAAYGAEITGVIYRTVWDGVNGSQGSQFHEVGRFECPGGQSLYGDDITFEDNESDADAAENPVLYTQGGPVEHNAPEMATYVSASTSRVTLAGLARGSEFQESKEQELDEGVNFSGLSSFFGRAPNPITGVVALDGVRILFTRTDVYTVSGDGPGNDASGALPPPLELGAPGGLRSWTSILKGPDGVWFQLDDAKLYRMPRGSGAPEWLGVDVQDTLASFPTVTGAARCRADDAVMFACQADDGDSARIVVRSLRTGIWLEDTPPVEDHGGITALCEFGDQVAYVSGGVVYALDDDGYTDRSGIDAAAIVTQWKTHPLYLFELGGNGKILDLQATCEWRSAGTLALRVSYDDGVSFTSYDSFALTGLTVGQTKKFRWALQQDDVQSIVAELTYTPDTPGAGLIVNQLTALVEDANGALEDLDPGDMA